MDKNKMKHNELIYLLRYNTGIKHMTLTKEIMTLIRLTYKKKIYTWIIMKFYMVNNDH